MIASRLAVVLMASFFLVAGCANQKPKEDSQIGHQITMAVVAFDSKRNETAPPYSPNPLFAAFPLIRGSLMGSPNTQPLMLLPTQFGQPMTIPMDELARLVEPLALPPNPEMAKGNLTVAPEDTRIARIGTVFYSKKLEQYVLGAGFFAKVTRDGMVLVYVDRPCRITGDVSHQGTNEHYKYDLLFAAPGLHWIRFKAVDSSNWKVESEPDVPSMVFAAIR